ncbi:MAG: ExbD/TolR family protein [Candidatus Acidiferrales bacterium]
MGMDVGGSKGGPMASMNVVPLIDILLVLLIIFMVITPLTPHGLDALVPQPPPPNTQPTPPEENSKVVVVQVLESGKLKINDEDTTWSTMGPRLTDIFKIRAEKIAFVKGDDAVQFAQVARAIDIMRASGIDSIGLITAKMESGG